MTKFKNHGIYIKIMEDGIACLIIPIMVGASARVEKPSIDALYQTLLLLTVTYPKFDLDDQFPRICVVLNNFSKTKGVR